LSDEGYEEKMELMLKEAKINPWSEVEIRTKDGLLIRGLVLPPFKIGREDIIFVKLPNGYNIGLSLENISKLRILGRRSVEYKIPEKEVKPKKGLPKVSLIGAGGTIASRVEYETGAVKPAFTPYELVNAIPEMFEIANIEPRLIFNIFSEDMTPAHWIRLAREVERDIRNGAEGVVITHGTDTMQYTASALAFMLQNLPVPVVLTGAQRSSDRPASDAATNVIASVLFAARGEAAEVVVSMHANSDDTKILIHRGVRVRKMHSSRRDAFRTIGDIPLALITPENLKIKYLRSDFDKRRKQKDDIYADAVFEEKVALLYTYPNMEPDLIHVLIDRRYRGLILAGTGLGHAPKSILEALKRAIEEGMLIFMTTQCIWGPVKMNVYERGRVLQRIGVIPADGLLPEVAYVKLGWLLGHKDLDKKQVIALMHKNLRHEIVTREPPNAYFTNV